MTSDVNLTVFDVWHQYLTSYVNIWRLASIIWRPTSNIWCLASNIDVFWLIKSKFDVQHQLFDVWFDVGRQKLTPDVKNRQIDVQRQILTSKVNIWRFRCFDPPHCVKPQYWGAFSSFVHIFGTSSPIWMKLEMGHFF